MSLNGMRAGVVYCDFKLAAGSIPKENFSNYATLNPFSRPIDHIAF
jgi:hypothetical protein